MPAKYRSSAIIIALIFLLVICLSAVQYLYCRDKLERRVLFFPTVSSARLVGEERLIPLKKGEDAIRILLADYFGTRFTQSCQDTSQRDQGHLSAVA